MVCPFDVRWHASLPSTMDAAAALAQAGAAHGVVVAAEQQTAGRGRRGTTWQSPPGAGLYFSVIARPGSGGRREGAASTLSLLTLAAGVGVRDGVAASTGLAPDLKWPNDLLVGRRKLAGILAEGHAIGNRDQAVIIGVGLNVQPAAYPPDVNLRATSLEGELGRPVDRETLLAAVLLGLRDRLAALEQSAGDILQAWRRASPSAIGTRVEWEGGSGVTAGIADDGALLVRTAAGIERVIAGEIRWTL
jgi:BirA family biotin operon repressor/biotin-[acetyl-CoA-carboxylase] ligase